MHNVRTILEAGFTSAYSGAASKMRLDVVIRNEIEAGLIPGPRMRATRPEIRNTSGLGDIRQEHQHRNSAVFFRMVQKKCAEFADAAFAKGSISLR
jgi:imidazolonepropionase-like amidohydrolase